MSIHTLLGFALLALGVIAVRFLGRTFKRCQLGRVWVVAHIVMLIAGIGLGIAAVAHSRYRTPETRLLGFPFLAAVFERSPAGGWVDFVGIVTLPATVGNFVVGLLLPQVLFATAVFFIIRRNDA